jgi:hypothetical protein
VTTECNCHTPAQTVPDLTVKVRMYRLGGLGDCFLLTFLSENQDPRYMLIDFGIFFATSGAEKRMLAVAEDIEKTTNRRLHVLVATHEHWDHLSGFKFAKDIFDRMQVDQVWVAWTEDPKHPLAAELRERRSLALKALQAAVTRLQASKNPQSEAILNVLAFGGDFSTALGVTSTAKQMEYVSKLSEDVRYLRPSGPPITWDELPGLRIFTLGPPEDRKQLTRSLPSGVEGEVYERPAALNQAAAFYAAALAFEPHNPPTGEERELIERGLPFDSNLAIPWDQAENHKRFGNFFRSHYGFADDPDHGPKWRRIDIDWLGTAADLALALDNDTNNTSLVLAIELQPGGKVLLFTGDAQVGNWLSWHDCSWPGEDSHSITGTDLVERTALYKISHHGSHNATLRDKGLELMNRQDLVALIPVDEKQAGSKRWAMPFEPLLQRLEEKTRGRILRGDLGVPEKPDNVSDLEWKKFLDSVEQDRDGLWVEYTVHAKE